MGGVNGDVNGRGLRARRGGDDEADSERDRRLLDKASACDFAGFLSSSRLFVHALNGEGLHALRAVLAERLRDLRLTKYASGSILDEWFENGVLVRPYTNDQDVYDLLKIVAGEPAVPAPPYDWAERRITSVENDPQGRAHVDSFASVVKVWLFDDVGEDAGPLHVVRGSHRHTLDRLAWEHARANGREALIEPSFRLTSNESDAGDAAAFVARCQRDAAPIVTQKPIVVVADTSLVHFRGAGRVGAVRRSRRLRGDNGGGLARRNPFPVRGRGVFLLLTRATMRGDAAAGPRRGPAAPPRHPQRSVRSCRTRSGPVVWSVHP